MATPKTEATELSVAFGLLGYEDPRAITYASISGALLNTLDEETFTQYSEEFLSDPIYFRMLSVGKNLRQHHAPFNALTELQWLGPDRQAATTSTAMDLLAANTPISVKAESMVVANRSPYNLFEATPQGSAPAKGLSSWYLETAFDEYQALYTFARDASGMAALPINVRDFENSKSKKSLKRRLATLTEDQAAKFQDLYVKMSHQVARRSAEIFNLHLADSMARPTRNAVLEHIAKMFFRMDTVPYILAGVDEKAEFASGIPDIASWQKQWVFQEIEATPALTKSQPVVNFTLSYQNRITKVEYTSTFRAEVRWSHGKFSSVEGKLYKDFAWPSLPFFKAIV